MLYTILKLVIKIAMKVYFRSIHVRNAEFVPTDVPLVIVANHPSSFMDPLVVGAFIRQKLYFITKGVMFNNKILRWIFNKMYMIPVYRPFETPELMYKNEATFKHCYNLLAKKKSIIIFPEGISETVRRLRKFKTGPARIALGAEKENNFELKVAIIPVGINYSNPHRFQSELFVNFSKPIDISQFFDLYKKDEFKAVRALTGHIKERIAAHTIDIENEALDELVKNIEVIYKSRLKKEFEISPDEKERDYLLTKEIVEAVYHFHRQDPKGVEKVKRKIQQYTDDLEKLELKDHLLKKASRKDSLLLYSLKTIVYLLLGFPFYLYGLINNYLPYKIPDFLANTLTKREDFYGAITMTTGIFTFLFFYTIQIWLVALYIPLVIDSTWIFPGYPGWISIVYAISLPFSGFFTWHYWKWLIKIRRSWLFISLFYRESTFIAKLIKQREEIIDSFKIAKDEYLEQKNIQV
ncbi:MAG: 1-acyl-sn-glycerol-3-phosphate acyltransferase [Bacteroidetes bacterium]|nr:1-acyl-sn-glycerol-3-phosphate acyltransferase [Bacteroidota bacterium]